MTAEELTHNAARERWGTPDEWEGSVNDPRTREENGVRFNEKWVYLLDDGSKRLIYWHRYGCRAVILEQPDGARAAEGL